MRILVLLGVLAGLLAVSCADPNRFQDKLWGQWVGQGGVQMEFSASGLIYMQTSDGKATGGRYAANFEQDPHELDIVLQDGKIIRTIFRWDAEGRLVLQSTEPGAARPTEFTNSAVYFTRKASPSPSSS